MADWRDVGNAPASIHPTTKEAKVTLDVSGMRELSIEELILVSGGDGDPPPPDPSLLPPDPSVINGIINSINLAPPPMLVEENMYVVSDDNGSKGCWDAQPDGEFVCLGYGVAVNGQLP
jgi:hypothetical protein